MAHSEAIIVAEGIYIHSACTREHYWEYDKSIEPKIKKCRACNREDNSLLTNFPELALEFMVEKNDIAVDYAAPMGEAVYWWKCQLKGHEFQLPVHARITAAGISCPECSSYENSLLATHPEIAKFYDNDMNTLPSSIVTARLSSATPVFWLCKEGHSYKRGMKTFLEAGDKHTCRVCYPGNKLFSPSESLAEKLPDMAKEFDSEKNGYNPDVIFHGSVTKYWWKCYRGHEWRTSPSIRFNSSNSVCPDCKMYETSLSALNPKLAKEFDSEKNNITPDKIAAHSNKKFWWINECGHKWDAPASARMRGNGCPYCSGFRVDQSNSLESLFPDIAECFDSEFNGLKANSVYHNSEKKYRWTCKEGHQFLQRVMYATKNDRFCDECNSLAFKFPELREQYSNKNKESFDSLSYGSSVNVLWICQYKHEYKQVISKKTTAGLGCPYCSGRYATMENNLLLAYPEIAKQFDSQKSGTTPDQVTPKSNRLMWWNCEKGHSYQLTPGKKTREDLPYGCPYCSSYRIDDTNSFAAKFPEIAREFQSELNGVTPDKISSGSSTIYVWKCPDGHIYSTSVASKTGSRKLKCPYCTGRYPTKTNNLAVVRPEVAKYFHPTKNHPLTASDFTPKSNRKIWWLCENGHDWYVTAAAKQGCARCSMSASSKIERLLRDAIVKSKLFDTVYEESVKLSLQWRKNSSMTVDILCDFGKHKVAFEYDGYYYHSGAMSKSVSGDFKKDTQKTQALLKAGYYVIRIREINPAGTLEMLPITDPKLLQIHHKYDQNITEPFTDTIEVISTWFATIK